MPARPLQALSAYQRRRGTLVAIHRRLAESLAPETVAACARRLGLVAGAVSGHASNVVHDYALYDHRETPEARTLVGELVASGRGLRRNDPAEAPFREWLATARYAIVEIRQVRRGEGVMVVDRIRDDDPFLLADVALSETAVPGLLIAGRVLRTDRFWLSSGAPIILDHETAAVAMHDAGGEVAAHVIRTCVERGLLGRVVLDEE